jgi:hypothetical protein
VDVLRAHDHVHSKPPVTDLYARACIAFEADDEARGREHGPPVLLPRGLERTLLRRPEDPAQALPLRACLDQPALALVKDAGVEARVTAFSAVLRIAEVDDVIADH